MKGKRLLPRAEAFVLLFFLAANLSWIARDTRPWPIWDSYDGAVHVMRAVGQDPHHPIDGVGSFFHTITRGGRPPMYQVLTIPFVAVFGYSEDAFLVVNLVLLVVLFIAMYGIGIELGGRPAGIAAAIAAVCFPPVVHLLHEYRAYNGAIAAVAVTVWTLLVLLRRRRPADAWTASAAATAALMMHPMVAYVLLVPMASTWLFLALSGRPVSGSVGGSGEPQLGWRALRTPLSVRGLLPAAVLPILVVWWWYRYFGRFLVHYFHTLRSSWVAAFRGTSRIVASAANVPADWRWLARTSPHHMGSILALLTLLSAVALLARGGTRGRFVTLWLAAAYAGTGVVIDSLSWQYAAFALPLAAAVLAGGVSVCPLRIRSVLAGLIVASSLVGFSILTWGVPSFSPAVARLLGIQREHCYLALCPDAPVSAHFPLDTALATVISQRPSGEESIFLATPVTLTATARYLLLRFHPKRRLRVVGTATPLFGNSLPFRSLLTSRWLLTLPPPSDHNPYLTAVFGMLRAPPPEVASSRRRVASFPWPGGRRLVLYERTRPPTLAEVDATLHALALPPRFVTGAALLAAGLLEREGRTDEAIDRLLAAARIEIQPPRLRAAILARAAALLLKSGRPHEAEARARQALAIVSWNATARRVIREVQRRRTAP